MATANALEASQISSCCCLPPAPPCPKTSPRSQAAATLENKLIIPVRLENIAPKGAFLYELASRNWINAFEDTEAKLEELAKALAQLVRTGTRDESVLPFERSVGAKPAPPARKRKTIPALVAGAVLVMAAVVGGLFWQHTRPATSQPQPTASRVAVLPFEMLGGNGDARTFADTISEQVVATLNDTQVQAVSREDAKTLSGTDRDDAAVKLGGRKLIVNGSVQSGDKGLHVTVHLDHVLTHATVWTASYDQQGLAASEFQSHIAAKAAGVAGNAIRARRDDPAEMDDTALGLLLKNAASDWTNTQESFLEQRDQLRAIIARAPKYAPSYLELSSTSSEMMKFASPDEIAQLRADAAKTAAQALALDPTNGEAYQALAMQVPNGRWADHEAPYRRGLAATPNSAMVQSYLADELFAEGRLREALDLMTVATHCSCSAPPLAATGSVGGNGPGRRRTVPDQWRCHD